jgi:hypothetical protein
MTWYSGDDAVVEHKIQVLKEAEHAGTATSSRLGKVGSHIIGEVILGGIKWARESVLNEPGMDVDDHQFATSSCSISLNSPPHRQNASRHSVISDRGSA